MKASQNRNKLVLDDTKFGQGITGFSAGYRASNLSYAHIKVKFDQVLQRLFRLTDYRHEFDGLVFHYGFNPSDGNLSYFISLGKFEPNSKFSVHPFPNPKSPSPYYELTNDSSTVSQSDSAHFTLRTTNYWCIIERLNQTSGNFEHLSDANIDPRMVFHPVNELIDFDDEYKTSVEERFLYIDHGARVDRLHTPMFRFGNNQDKYEIDDIDYRARYGYTERYRNKAFNIGQLCPPGCASVAPNCPTTP